MPYHEWGDEDFDWTALEDAITFCVKNMRRWGRICVHGKEKYGTMRLEFVTFGFTLHQFFFPPYLFKHKLMPKWLWCLDQNLVYGKFRVYNWLVNWWYVPYQKWLYRFILNRAVKKWPHIKEEIIDTNLWMFDK